MSTYAVHDVTGIDYDKNGNIGYLNRNGADQADSTYGIWDDLLYLKKTEGKINLETIIKKTHICTTMYTNAIHRWPIGLSDQFEFRTMKDSFERNRTLCIDF